MRKQKPLFKVKRIEQAAPSRVAKKWACVDTRDGSIISTFRFRKNAVAAAGLADSVERYMGGI